MANPVQFTPEDIQNMMMDLQQLRSNNEALQSSVRNLTLENERMKESTLSSTVRMEEAILRSVPRWRDDSTVLFREHIAEVDKYISVRSSYLNNDQLCKTVLWESISGRAVHKVINNQDIKESYKNDTYKQFCRSLREAFNPDSERGLVRTEFHSYNQGPQQDVASYLTAKFSLYDLSYEEGERSFDTLRTAVIKGLLNLAVRREVRRKNPKTESELRDAVVEATAAERDAYCGGYSESTSAAGLVTISNTKRTIQNRTGEGDNVIPMEVDVLAPKTEKRCFRCNRGGHLKADCIAKRSVEGKELPPVDITKKKKPDGKNGKRCHNCHKIGHYAKECRSKKVNSLKEEGNDMDEWGEALNNIHFLGVNPGQPGYH